MGFRNYIWDEQFNLNVARGKVRGAKVVNIFWFQCFYHYKHESTVGVGRYN